MNELNSPLELLEDYSDRKHKVTAEELERKYDKIRSVLAVYDLNPKEITSVAGPVITVFHVPLDRKMKKSELKNLTFDIEFALNIRGVSVKAGAGGFDIEIPNEYPSIVLLKDIICSDKFRNTDYRLPIAAGVDVADMPKIIDLAEAPNILVGGSVKQGKTTALASMIVSLMYTKSPEDIRFVLIDPTMTGLTFGFAKLDERYLPDLPGLDEKKAVISDAGLAEKTLEALCEEMENRLKDKKNNPHIVAVIDEYGDLVARGPKLVRIMNSIIKLAQHGMDTGIHLLISTCRLYVDIVTGVIKANFPVRIALRTATAVDSQTVLDCRGAEKLTGNGDSLYLFGTEPKRLQTPYISLEEISEVLKFIHAKNFYDFTGH